MPNSAAPAEKVSDRSGTSWVARYGQVILSDGIAAIPRALFLYQARLNLSAQEVWFIAAILSHKWDGLLPRPSLKQMAREAGVTVKWLRELRTSLETKQYLQVTASHQANGAQQTNTYDFSVLFRRLEEFICANMVGAEAEDSESPQLDITLGEDQSFTARFGRVILREGIAAIPQALFHYQADLQLKPQHLWFICYVLSFRWSMALPHPSLRGMAAKTGYSVRQIHNLKDELIAQQYLTLVHRHAKAGQDTNGYDFSRLFEKVIELLQPAVPVKPFPIEAEPAAAPAKRRGRHSKSGASEPGCIAEWGAPPVHREGGTASSPGGGYHQFIGGDTPGSPGGGHRQFTGGDTASSSGGIPLVHRGGTAGTSGGSTTASTGGGTASSHEEESIQEEPIQEDDSNRAGGWKNDGNGSAKPRYSPYIAAVILDYSRELGDAFHGPSNVSQALRLWQDCGLPEDTFVAQLHEARRLTRQYQGKQGHGNILNKMAYYFQVVRDLVGQKTNC